MGLTLTLTCICVAFRERGSEERSRKLKKKRMEKKDMIGNMPNDIIWNILSRLKFKEAVRTSVLSTKWRYQWTYFTGVLDFDPSLRTYLLRRKRVGLLKKCMVFVSEWEKSMVNLEKMLKLMKSPTMQGLRICMELGNPLKIDEWVKFGVKKDVKMFELDLSYNFTETFYEISQTIRNVLSSTTIFEMKSLCILRLVSVDVSDEVIEGILACCPSLQTLCVIESKLLVRVKVCGQGLRLKHLELVECRFLTNLDISAENLMTFKYIGDYERFNYESVPSLVEASFGGLYSSYLQSRMNTVDLYELLLQLDVLKLELLPIDFGTVEALPLISNVKQLEMQILHGCGAKLDRPVSLLSAFPSICVLKLKFIRYSVKPAEEQWKANLKDECPNLRELEVSGFRRDPSQIELVMSICEKAPNLNRIVVDPLSSYHAHRSPNVKARIREMRRDFTIWFADCLKPYLPPPIELIIL
ncbi:hypothetical protein VNO77_36503 [Canavalia gladiata]|uniref:F-box domain-containing protein n=1 Tax=Canavalia gladiata TaxID=3824 RepID=A0AAN9PUD0_CANGL